MATKIFDNPKNEIEREIAEYMKPLVTPEVEEKIKADKLTLSGCWDYCHKQGAKHKVGNCAKISDEQHFSWVRKYFGLSGKADIATPLAAETPAAASNAGKALSLDLDGLFG